MALDLSYTNTGIAVFYDGIFQKELSKTKGTKPADGTDIHRCDMILAEIVRVADVVTRSREKPLIFIEDYAFARNNLREKMGELGGVVKHGLWTLEYKTQTLPIATVRKVVTGKGNAAKDMVMMSLLKNYGLEIPQNDLADAAAVGITGDYIMQYMEDNSVILRLPIDVREGLKGYLKNK